MTAEEQTRRNREIILAAAGSSVRRLAEDHDMSPSRVKDSGKVTRGRRPHGAGDGDDAGGRCAS